MRCAVTSRQGRGWPMSASAAIAALAASLLAAGPVWAATAAATWTFAAGKTATCPGTVTTPGGAKIVVDLSALPKGATVFRAVLVVGRRDVRPHLRVNNKILVVAADRPDEPLQLRGPRHTTLDATAAVARAVKAGKGKAEFAVKSMRGWLRDQTRLEVAFAGAAAKKDLPKVTRLTARHRQGQTILTWAEVDPPTQAEKITIEELRGLRRDLAKRPAVSYRIYRSARPITPANVAEAALVDAVGQLTGWNRRYWGQHARYDKDLKVPLTRYVVEDGKDLVPPGTAVHAHNPAKAGRAWYAVTAAIDGAEDFAKAAVTGPIEETTGPGPFVLQRVVGPTQFQYVKDSTLKYYVRWESPPRCNLPSTPYDYLVAVPPKLRKPAPLQVALHCWGGSLNGGYGGWHGGRDGALLIATNQIPYDWWVSYHEGLHTWRTWSEGVCRDYTVKRVLAFLDWVQAGWDVDASRVYLKGGSMGGSGAGMIALRYPRRFAFSLSSVGVHNAAGSPQFRGSYEGCVGAVGGKLKHESGLMVWDYLSNSFLLRQDPARDMPFLCFGNGKDDHGIGWPQALDFAQACQQARQPHTFGWGLGGHTAPVHVPPVDVTVAQSVPAFSRCSLDDDPGTATKLEKPKEYQEGKWLRKDLYDGKPYGQFNAYLAWDAKTIVDEADRWEMTVRLFEARGRKLPKEACTVDVTPRRCRKFKPKAGETFKWTSTSPADGKAAQSGTVTADKWGLVTLEKVTVTKDGNRLSIARP